MFRRNVTLNDLETIFHNPRVHTGKGYQRRANIPAPLAPSYIESNYERVRAIELAAIETVNAVASGSGEEDEIEAELKAIEEEQRRVMRDIRQNKHHLLLMLDRLRLDHARKACEAEAAARAAAAAQAEAAARARAAAQAQAQVVSNYRRRRRGGKRRQRAIDCDRKAYVATGSEAKV